MFDDDKVPERLIAALREADKGRVFVPPVRTPFRGSGVAPFRGTIVPPLTGRIPLFDGGGFATGPRHARPFAAPGFVPLRPHRGAAGALVFGFGASPPPARAIEPPARGDRGSVAPEVWRRGPDGVWHRE